MTCLIIAGEATFGLPYLVARFFRATFLQVFDFTNAQLGDAFAAYGVVAMFAYFAGGPLADRYSARRLITVSLLATGAGGLYMATIPGILGTTLLYAYWGMTTILFLWAAMIRATREWGGRTAQGRAFGVLDGGRGLVAAILASLGVFAFSLFFPEQAENVTAAERRDALTAVIYLFTFAVFASALSCWIWIPDSTPGRAREKSNQLTGLGEALREPRIWLQALVVICAYCGYKGLDNYSLYAVQALGMDELEAGEFTAACAYIRPVAAIASGFLADRFSTRKVIAGLFVLLIVSYGFLARFAPSPGFLGIIYGNLLVSFFAVYGLRGVYFALLEEAKIPNRYTGAAVGVISFVGYTPDAFFAPIAGRLLDQSPGIAGHQHVFAMLAGIATLGTIAIGVLMRPSAARSSENTT